MAKINYQQLLDTALKSVVKEALIHAQFNGLGDEASFFITFKTRDAGVVLPDFLRITQPVKAHSLIFWAICSFASSQEQFSTKRSSSSARSVPRSTI